MQVVLAKEPSKNHSDLSAVAHHRRLIEKYGGWRSQVGWGLAGRRIERMQFCVWGGVQLLHRQALGREAPGGRGGPIK